MTLATKTFASPFGAVQGVVWRVMFGRISPTSIRRYGVVLGALLALQYCGGAGAADSQANVRQWLEKLAMSAGKFTYEGTFVYRHGDQLMAMRVTHLSKAHGGRERVTALNGKVREVFRTEDGVACIMPERKVVFVDKAGSSRRLLAGALEHIPELERYYKFSLAGSGRVAGRASRIIFIEPRDGYRYGYRVWVDEGAGLVLQSDMLNERGEALEQVMFTGLQIIDKPAPALLDFVTLKDFPVEQARAAREAMGGNVDSPWEITQMPSGFVVREHYRHRNSPDAPPMEHIVLTDGLATVSVFIEQLSKGEKAMKGPSRMGAVSAFGAVFNNNYQVTVVGEVPAATVQMIGQSIGFNK